MEKQKRWQFFLIIAVMLVTLYNILPTIIYYAKPLRSPINQEAAQGITKDIAARVNNLEQDALEWVQSFTNLLGIRPTTISLDKDDPSMIHVSFQDKRDAQVFRKFMPTAGLEIPFVPSQLGLMDPHADSTTLTVTRRLNLHLEPEELPKLFHFASKADKNGDTSPFYFSLVGDRVKELLVSLNGGASGSSEVRDLLDGKEQKEEPAFAFCQKINFIVDTFGADSSFTKRYFKTLLPTDGNGSLAYRRIVARLEDIKRGFEEKKKAIVEKHEKETPKEALSQDEIAYQDWVNGQLALLDKTLALMARNKTLLEAGVAPITKMEVEKFLASQYEKNKAHDAVYTFSFADRHPLFSQLSVDFGNEYATFELQPDVIAFLAAPKSTEAVHIQQDMLSRQIMDEVTRICQATDENLIQDPAGYRVNFSHLPSSSSLLVLDLGALGKKYVTELGVFIGKNWKPSHNDLIREKLPILAAEAYNSAPTLQKKLCLAVIAPTLDESYIPGLRRGSIYVVLRGMQSIIDQYAQFPDSRDAQVFSGEFQALYELLQKRGFIGYSGATLGLSSELYGDYIFELDDYSSLPIKATREDFYVLGSKKYAALEFSDVEQRITAENRIEDAIQEDLLRWKEAYGAAQVDLNPFTRYTIPKPTKNAYWENCKLATRKYFRGDDSKILRWGLDLAGGKSVRISLIDSAGKTVEKPAELRQAVNELYTRINKMGVSERTIRLENATILIDFPGSQGLSASELVKASAMYFHVVNEKFGVMNHTLSKEVNEFLQEVWNEATVTGRQDAESLNEIAFDKLELARKQEALAGPKTAAQVLYKEGLRLANPRAGRSQGAFDDSLSMIARYRGDDIKAWGRQANPLLFVFRNYALEGASLENVQTGYDPTQGNVLYFSVKSSLTKGAVQIHPRDDFYAWTSQFSKDGVAGTPREAFSNGRGWRMAVILNDMVVSAPQLNAALRDHAMISGNFSQREVAKLASDLRAGSLSFSPRILSERNVSPELGELERTKGIMATIIGIVLVIAAMIGYYRFAGIVATCAVLVNILIIWAVLQNIDAALTLPGLAGMVLTVAMAVDANVLIFERVREEFKLTGRIASSIQAGYRKAFSAILDSNLTTMIAAIILLQFDCGPIKGFAMTLIIGISSSMFTALFMTRYFFAGWVQNPEHKELKMREWIKAPHFDFLKMARPAVMCSIIVFSIGVVIFLFSSKGMVGMDFTGGYALTCDLESTATRGLTEQVAAALEAKGVHSQELQIRELGRPNLLRIQLATSLEEAGRPFYNMPHELTEGTFKYDYEKNPRIAFVVHALAAKNLMIKPSQLSSLSNNWTAMSGQFSDTMRNNAIFALLFALVAVLIYIAIRFEWKYAIASVVALIHDVLVTLAIMVIMNRCGAPIQLNLETIGAIMTLIGYSLSDTIIIFDRIREDIRLLRKMSFPEIINYALNQTLSRTLMTSGTTFLVLLSLDIFAGSSIFGFAFVMTSGVFFGTLSSLFIASPVLLWLHNREEAERLGASV
jgi:SecD/SecF fusion protein